MFISSDPWTALTGNNVHQYSQPKPQVPFYHGLLGGVAVCDSHLVGLKGWYWAQAVALWKAQQTMAHDNWMSGSEAGEEPCFRPEDQPVQDPFWVPTSGPPFYSNVYGGQVPYAVDPPPLPFQCDPTAVFAAQEGHAASDMSMGMWSDIYVSPSPESGPEFTGARYVLDLDGSPDMKSESNSPSTSFMSFHSAEEWISPGCPKYKTSPSPAIDAIPPQVASYTATLPASRSKPQNNKTTKDRKPLPSARRQTRQRKLKARTRSPTPEPRAPCKKAAPLPCLPRGADRAARDEFLVKAKRAGRTYKEIRALGGFAEAESTLRGRFRTLTKRVEERLRKPVWADIDIQLLGEAVFKLSKGQPSAVAKISWSDVSEHILRNGGTYRFGNATCAKKWDELGRQYEY